MINAHDSRSASDVLQAFEDTIATLQAFSKMLAISLRHGGGDLKSNAFGVSQLLDPQIDDLAFVLEQLRSQETGTQAAVQQQAAGPVQDIREALLGQIGTDDLHRVATKLGLDEGTVYNVVVSLAIPDTGREQAKPADLRNEFIADKIKEGVDAGQIAQALNLKRATVERVIAKLLAGQSDHETEDEQAAVNG